MLFKDRHQLFEFCDQPWLKGVFREAYLDCLNAIHIVSNPYRKMHLHFKNWATAANGENVLDLCSGGGEQLAILLKNAKKERLQLPKIYASDLFPDIEAYRKLQSRFGETAIAFINKPVRADQIQDILSTNEIQLISICTALHHFPPEIARKIISNALGFGKGVLILEISKRKSILPYFGLLLALPLLLLTPLFSRRFNWQKLILTTVFPIAPLMVWFDGFVSHLRSYTEKEIMELIPKDSEIVCEYGEYSYFGFNRASYFYAYRKSM